MYFSYTQRVDLICEVYFPCTKSCAYRQICVYVCVCVCVCVCVHSLLVLLISKFTGSWILAVIKWNYPVITQYYTSTKKYLGIVQEWRKMKH